MTDSQPVAPTASRPLNPALAKDAPLASPRAGPPAPARAPLPSSQPRGSKPDTGGGTRSVKMNMSAVIIPDGGGAPKMSMTSKEWVIPPRPKPGRKPATDTPPTKRKAQNRAAQRAFRERRAARVGELEQQLDEQRGVYDRSETELKEKIRGLELDLQSFRSRCVLLENMLDRERQERLRTETQAASLRRRVENLDASSASSLSHEPPSRRSSHRTGTADAHFSIPNMITPPETQPPQHGDLTLGCGNCSLGGPCACAEQVLGCGNCAFGGQCRCLEQAATGHDLKRPSSPSRETRKDKRHCGDANAMDSEMDFSSVALQKQHERSPPPRYPSSDEPMPLADSVPLKDRCGFCVQGTYCMCAEEASMATPAATPTATLPPISHAHQQHTPPPSEPDFPPAPPLFMEMTADGAVKLPPRRPRSLHAKPSKTNTRGCGANGPGTCAQCQADPKSGLFCRLMAAKFDREKQAGGCCGSSGSTCCKASSSGPTASCSPTTTTTTVGAAATGATGATNTATPPPPLAPSRAAPLPPRITLPSLPSLGLSCAEAYQTLSSHRNFDRAADDIGSWLPKLKATTPVPGPARGRQSIEVEAASIMSVLKEFDVRFGREC
ncbi:hypothetical protein CDD82_7041 [Ophiocordyceps australis]|uniref:BZIP domain-containing protein n=1 Tax=Ophiocordyceps australis TaxID=1399860 RepID=A0A2C5YT99_9HYPO|nr:hypothetical protein CDD82_7041 [Ophiocordyceps australis]